MRPESEVIENIAIRIWQSKGIQDMLLVNDYKAMCTSVYAEIDKLGGMPSSQGIKYPKRKVCQFIWAHLAKKDKNNINYKAHLRFLDNLLDPPFRVGGYTEVPTSYMPTDNMHDAIAYAYTQLNQESTIMKSPVNTITYVYGVDINTMDDAALIGAIKRVQADQKALLDLNTPSKKVDKMLTEYSDAVALLVARLDKDL